MGNDWARGISPYTYGHHYVYPPFYVYIIGLARMVSGGELPAYYILIKLPLIAADFFAGLLIVGYVLRTTKNEKTALAAGALYLFNPLLLYNTAYYGRLDQLCTFFVIASIYFSASSGASALALAVSVCAKTVPLFLYPYFLKNFRRLILNGAVLAVLGALITLPMVLKYHNAAQIYQQVFCNIDSTPRGLSWQVIFYKFLPVGTILSISQFFLAAYLLTIVIFPKRHFVSYAAFVFTAFVLFSKAVHGQYATWAIPFLIMDRQIHGKKHAGAMAAVLTVSGLLNAEYAGHNFFAITDIPQSLYNLLLAVCVCGYLAAEYKWAKSAGSENTPENP